MTLSRVRLRFPADWRAGLPGYVPVNAGGCGGVNVVTRSLSRAVVPAGARRAVMRTFKVKACGHGEVDSTSGDEGVQGRGYRAQGLR